ncbi:MAG TPA: type III-B CRISPR-associated protein Cas10/Cmr2, partial [Agitococcus sp.]|nr:type III-B CRISPR-associated protein Cas10/Cmr2 [Agitococcus sp.]
LARIHDPAEKAIVLMNTPKGHEGGTVADLKKEFFNQAQLTELYPKVQKADHWAAAADRPTLPKADKWAQINFLNDAALIHPLSGEHFRINGLSGTDIEAIKKASLAHSKSLIQRDKNGNIDYKKTNLALWRFQSEGKMLEGGWGALWEQLPADTRIPDHTIWTHLDLTSAFAGCFTAQESGDTPVLFSMQFGPVQDFIAQARSTSDLWAGSHLLSRLTWEGIKVLCQELGPDSVLIPQLRGVAMVDAWLYKEEGLAFDLFEQAGAEWTIKNDDSNPLFAAALPNKFTALVPKSKVKDLAEKIEQHVKSWVLKQGQDMLIKLLLKADINPDDNLPCYKQLTEQLAGFPEVYWAAVPFDIISADSNGKATLKQDKLQEIQGSFIPVGKSFLETNVWGLLSKGLTDDNITFWQPNAGVLFPAIYELLERLTASVKQARHFEQLQQKGYRCTLTGEVEWLTTNSAHLALTPRQRKVNKDTLWAKLEGSYGIKKGEFLGALGMIKRLWPSVFAQWVGNLLGEDDNNNPNSARRYVVSTHAMSLAPALTQLRDIEPEALGKLLPEALAVKNGVTLPRKLLSDLGGCHAVDIKRRLAKQLPALMDEYRTDKETEAFNRQMEKALGVKPEAYYAIFFMDGDNMGAWLTGGNEGEQDKYNVKYQHTFHPTIQSKLLKDQYGMKLFKGNFNDYLRSYRAVSPARHMAVSGALNSFALHLARYIVEDCYMGKLFYAGGDDVMAMVAVKDLLPCIYTLRLAYSGVYAAKPTEQGKDLLNLEKLKFGGGHALLNGHLYRTMGHKATASVGAVIAHHTAPLQHVLSEVRKAEKTAKNAGRDAFALKIIKRAGGAVDMNGRWLLEHQTWGNVQAFNAHLQQETIEGDLTPQHDKLLQLEDSRMGLLMQIVNLFSHKSDLSRKLAYVVQDWLPQLPQLNENSSSKDKHAFVCQLQTLLAYQLRQQGLKDADKPEWIAKQMLQVSGATFNTENNYNCPHDLTTRLANTLAVAEFLGRAQRQANPKQGEQQ